MLFIHAWCAWHEKPGRRMASYFHCYNARPWSQSFWYCACLSFPREDAITFKYCTVELGQYLSGAILLRYEFDVCVLLHGAKVRNSIGLDPPWPYVHVDYCHSSWLTIIRELFVCTGSSQLLWWKKGCGSRHSVGKTSQPQSETTYIGYIHYLVPLLEYNPRGALEQ